MNLNQAIIAIQNGNATISEQTLMQTNQTIWDPNNICNMPSGCNRISIIRTDEAQPVIEFLREAINA
jgi:hypothetical protein